MMDKVRPVCCSCDLNMFLLCCVVVVAALVNCQFKLSVTYPWLVFVVVVVVVYDVDMIKLMMKGQWYGGCCSCLFKPWAICRRTIIANNQMCCSPPALVTFGLAQQKDAPLSWAPICHKYNCSLARVEPGLSFACFVPSVSFLGRRHCIVFFGVFHSFLRNQKKTEKQNKNTHKCWIRNGNGNSWTALIIVVVYVVVIVVQLIVFDLFMQFLFRWPLKSPSRDKKYRWQALPKTSN